MIDPHEIGLSVLYAGPVVISSLCLTGILPRWKEAGADRRKLYRILTLFLVCVATNWAFILLYIFTPVIYARLNIVCYLTFPILQVLFYHFIYTLTRVPGQRPFDRRHYYVLFLIVLVFGVWSLFVPFDVKYHIVITRGEAAPGYELYSRMFTLRIPLKTLYTLVYAFLSWRMLLRYRRVVADYSADTGRSTLGWVVVLLCLTVALIFIPVFGTIYGQEKSVETFVTGLAMIPIAILLILASYHTINGHYVIIENSAAGENHEPVIQAPTAPPTEPAPTGRGKKGDFERKFEWYMRHKKPYLNSQLRIGDLAARLSTDCNTLSAFINTTYGMNFSRYINRLRLREMEVRGRMPDYEKASLTELALASGFSSYRSYRKFLTGEQDAENDRPVVN